MSIDDLRVRVERRHSNLYSDMTQHAIVTEYHVLFFTAACIGFKLGRRVPLVQRQEKFWSRTFAPEERTCMSTMALTLWEGKFDRIQDDKAVVEMMEEYATGGLDYLVETVIPDFLLRDAGEPRLDQTAVEELPRVLVYELWQMSDLATGGHSGAAFELTMKRSEQP
jgi:hypothetical protein